MGGGEYRTMDESENDHGSLARSWWNRAPAQESSRWEEQSSQAETGEGPSQETEDLAGLNSVVPRPQQPPPSRPAKSKPVDIPKKRTTPPPVFEVAQDKRYWYQ